MTLDEAIKHCENVAAKCFVERSARNHSGKCGFEHLELAAWLRELKVYKEQGPCEDAISRKAAVVQLYHNKTGDDDVDVIIERDIATIHKLPPVTPKQKWIPVSERLPEKSMRCLVVVGRFNFIEIATYSDLMGIIDHKIFYQGVVGHDDFVNITSFVKAWMPLPKSYKAESEGKE
jgi:hypothetical protein